MKNFLYLLIVIVAMVIAVGINEFRHVRMHEQNPKEQAQQAMPVIALALKAEVINIPTELPGRTAAYKVSEVRPQVDGIIKKRLFIEGGHVKEGEQLYQIDEAPYLAIYESAKANLASAEAALKTTQVKASRYQALVKVGAVSKQDNDDIQANLSEAEANVKVAKAAVDTAKINLDYTKVYAPISGIIGKSSVTEGALVNANQATALALITQLDPIYVDMTMASEYARSLRQGLKNKETKDVTLTRANETVIGEIQFLDVTIDESTDSLSMRALFPNPKEDLLPGQFVRPQVNVTASEAILVPQQATMRDPEGNLILWLIQPDNTVKQATFKSKGTIGNSWLVAEGVQAGDKIVIDGIMKMSLGKLVAPSFASSKEQ